jgi:hypothetical protein
MTASTVGAMKGPITADLVHLESKVSQARNMKVGIPTIWMTDMTAMLATRYGKRIEATGTATEGVMSGTISFDLVYLNITVSRAHGMKTGPGITWVNDTTTMFATQREKTTGITRIAVGGATKGNTMVDLAHLDTTVK